jgi:hypothetical protein
MEAMEAAPKRRRAVMVLSIQRRVAKSVTVSINRLFFRVGSGCEVFHMASVIV